MRRSRREGARNVGAAADPEEGPARTVFGDAVARVAVRVPELVTAPLGVDERMVPSPANVTLETVPPPAAVVEVVYQLVRLEAS